MVDIVKMYQGDMSITEISKSTGIPVSTVRNRLHRAGVLRSRADGVRVAASKGKLGSGNKGKKRNFTEEWKRNISKGRTGKGAGRRITKAGYVEYTAGPNKGRLEHVVIMEQAIGRRLNLGECVHHIDQDKQNNKLENLMVMTRSEHARLHATELEKSRSREQNGRFI